MAYPIYRAFSGTIAVLANVAIVLWTCWRLFRAIRFHRRCTADLVEFNKLVCQSSLSVDYIAAKVSETMEQIKEDIGKELSMTDRLTKLSAKVAGILARFSQLEENAIELLRTEYNMENVRIETPSDVKEEINRIVEKGRRGQGRGRGRGRDLMPNPSRISVTPGDPTEGDVPARISISKFSASRGQRNRVRPLIFPEVRLLEDSASERQK